MNEEALAGEVPVSDANATPEVAADSSPAPVAPESVAAEAGNQADEIPRLQKRFDKLTWEKGELSRRAEAAERRAYELEQRFFERQQPEQKPEATSAPTLEQYGHDEAKYQLAVTEYARSVARAEAQEAIRAERYRGKAEDRAKTFKTRESEFSAKTEDYQEKVYDPSLSITRDMVELIAESPDGPALAYYLANNRDQAAAIAALPPMLAAREMGKIEATLSQPKPSPIPVSKAPAPPPKVDAVEPDIKKGIDDPSLSDKEFAAIRRRQIAQRR